MGLSFQTACMQCIHTPKWWKINIVHFTLRLFSAVKSQSFILFVFGRKAHGLHLFWKYSVINEMCEYAATHCLFKRGEVRCISFYFFNTDFYCGVQVEKNSRRWYDLHEFFLLPDLHSSERTPLSDWLRLIRRPRVQQKTSQKDCVARRKPQQCTTNLKTNWPTGLTVTDYHITTNTLQYQLPSITDSVSVIMTIFCFALALSLLLNLKNVTVPVMQFTWQTWKITLLGRALVCLCVPYYLSL